jgi:hypothetical protein
MTAAMITQAKLHVTTSTEHNPRYTPTTGAADEE